MAAHQEIAFRTAYLVLGDAAEAQDAAQEAFVKAYRALDRFREGAAFRPWLLRIVANTARNRRRAAGRRRGLQLRAEAATPRDATAPSAEAAVLACRAPPDAAGGDQRPLARRPAGHRRPLLPRSPRG